MLIFVTNNCYNESQFIRRTQFTRSSDIVSPTCTYRNIECTSSNVGENNADSNMRILTQIWTHRSTNINLLGSLSTEVTLIPAKSYSYSAKFDSSSTKHQIIIIHAENDISHQYYALKTGRQIGLKAIRYGLETSNSWICLYLDKTVTHVNNFPITTTIKNKTENIRHSKQKIYETRTGKRTEVTRSFIILAQSVVLSNVFPATPKSEFQNIFKVTMLIYPPN